MTMNLKKQYQSTLEDQEDLEINQISQYNYA